MDRVIDRLWIGSLEAASDLNSLQTNGIVYIIALGCESVFSRARFEYCSLPNILDTPESNVLDLLPLTNDFIAKAIKQNNGNILVHCVYGQSRSATVITSYLMSTGMTLEQSLHLLKSMHPNICINPGFLCQLHLLSMKKVYPVEYLLARFSLTNINIQSSMPITCLESTNSRRRTETYSCKTCKSFLATDNDTIQQTADHSTFLRSYCDDFWKDYRPIISSSSAAVTLPIHGCRILRPLHWMIPQINKNTQGILCCQACNISCGYWKKDGLVLCGGFLTGYLFVLEEEKVLINIAKKRKIIAEEVQVQVDAEREDVEDDMMEDGKDRTNTYDNG
eukprot:gene10441-21787_t